jgi:hypothetical protein
VSIDRFFLQTEQNDVRTAVQNSDQTTANELNQSDFEMDTGQKEAGEETSPCFSDLSRARRTSHVSENIFHPNLG